MKQADLDQFFRDKKSSSQLSTAPMMNYEDLNLNVCN